MIIHSKTNNGGDHLGRRDKNGEPRWDEGKKLLYLFRFNVAFKILHRSLYNSDEKLIEGK